MRFDWDQHKARGNRTKHGVGFDEAASSFLDPHALRLLDETHSSTREDRFILVGMSLKSRVLFVVYCEEGIDLIRIISARKATSRERRDYEEIRRKNFGLDA